MNQSSKKPVTLQDVAKHAGVSRATASLIVRNSPKISSETRKKVLKSMEELGYVYDRVAANLRSKSSTTIGIIITDISNTYYSDLLKGVHHTLEEIGYTVLLGVTFDSVEKQDQILSSMIEHRVGGIILCPVSESADETVNRLNKLQIPAILAVRELAGSNCDFVGVDYQAGSQMAVEHLIKKGHKRVAFLGGYRKASTWIERMEGYSLALQQAGIELDGSIVIDSVPTREGGVDAVRQLLSLPNRPTAIFCFSDLVAFGVVQGVREAGLKPGEDIAIMGFDNIPEAEIFYPPLSTVSSFAQLTGKTAANLLHQRITQSEGEKKRIILQPELIVREST
ncbi:LacI family DNA-binding transcriptional regulator [Niallia endozanthoxylica]|uniref:Substrate-binding domain-containing protein n=1 Tax=Niallia endozanthoxylica TaxID=2036016 RepID=A0A5J5I643_9BACI|nr:LacI family DNA-binding transcriptional regulator [Niallia endozanthoxylica]KAA9029909.1 substrate-binding domain-containing protein [Niallia endozanthoxylica]